MNFSLNVKAKTVFDDDLDVNTIVMKLGALFFNRRFKLHRILIFLDEIQDYPNARTLLKAFVLDGRYNVIASKSFIGLRKNDVSSYPVGYEHEIHMNPMDFEEFPWALDIDEGAIKYVRRHISERRPMGDAALQVLEGTQDVPRVQRPRGHHYQLQERRLEACRGGERINVDYCFNSVPVQFAQVNRRFFYLRIGEQQERRDGGIRVRRQMAGERGGSSCRATISQSPARPSRRG